MGDRFSIEQYWNGVDFYSTELIHRTTSGETYSVLIDGDDSKVWKCRFEAEGKASELKLLTHRNFLAIYNWDTHTLTRPGGRRGMAEPLK